MKLWEIEAPRKLTYTTVPDPAPGVGEALISIDFTGVSPGTELFAFRSGPTEMMTAPGYLATGTVADLGSGTTGIALGTRVLLSAPHGSMAVRSVDKLTPLPDDVGSDVACFTHLASLGHRCLHAGGYRPGDDVAVVGAGLVGVCTALVANLAGARVHSLDVLAERLALPQRLGIAVYDAGSAKLVDDITSASLQGIDLVVDTSGHWSGLYTATKVARHGSTICVLGVNRTLPSPETGQQLFDELFSFPSRFHYEGLTIVGCGGHPATADTPGTWFSKRAYEYLLGAMSDGRLDLDPLLTDHIEPSALDSLMGDIDAGQFSGLGAVLDWSAA